MGAGRGVKTGRTKPNEAFAVPQVNSVYDLLSQQGDQNALGNAGTALLTEDPTKTNLGLANNLIANQSRQFNQGLTRSMVGRGIGNSGLASTAMATGNAGISGELINNALARSFSEKLQARQTGAGLLQAKGGLNEMLANFVQNLVGAGISGQVSDYGARAGIAGARAGAGIKGLVS